MNAMNNIRESLTRRLGPLPAWAWLVGFAVAVVLYRRWSRGGTIVNTGASGEVVDSTATPGDPLTVAAGEGIYDPATGQLKTVAPETLPLDPVTIEPGQAVYDPNTGKTTETNQGTTAPTMAPTVQLTPQGKKTPGKQTLGGKTGGGKKGGKKGGGKHVMGSGPGLGLGGRRGGTKKTPHMGASKPANARDHKNKPAATPGPAAPIPVAGKTIPRGMGTVQPTTHTPWQPPPMTAAPIVTKPWQPPPMMATPVVAPVAAPVIPRMSAPAPFVAPAPPARVPSAPPAPRAPVMQHVSVPQPKAIKPAPKPAPKPPAKKKR